MHIHMHIHIHIHTRMHRRCSNTRKQLDHTRWKTSLAEDGIDTEAGMLSGISRKRSIRSNPYWFTEFCNSQCLSHFAAPFIVVRAETSVAESCDSCKRWWKPPEAMKRYMCVSTNSGSFTAKEDGPMLIHYPRTSARESGCNPHPRTEAHKWKFTVKWVDACE